MDEYTLQLGITVGETYPGTGIFLATTRLQYAGEMARLSAEGKTGEVALENLALRIQETLAARGWPPVR